MKHLGDITKINGAEIEPVNVITFGSPCQDLSVAGKRAGLDGERSGLFMEAVRIIKEMRNNDRNNGRTGYDIRPRFAIWENVPGAFTSGTEHGADFRCVLEELSRIAEADATIPMPKKWEKAGFIEGNNWSIAWRQFDAQYWGVPQRRKRIALVVDFADRCAGQILFECEGMSGNIESSIETWKGIAQNPERSIRECDTEESYTLKLRHTGSDLKGGGVGPMITDNMSCTLSTHQDQTLFNESASD